MALALGIGAVLLGILVSNGLGPLLVPVMVYGLAISAMLWRALARLGTGVPKRSAWLAAAGALAFLFSDSLIGINRFVQPFHAAPYLIIVSYWLGQWGLRRRRLPKSGTEQRSMWEQALLPQSLTPTKLAPTVFG